MSPGPRCGAHPRCDHEAVAATADLSTGESEPIRVELEPGDYTTFCSLAGRESLGMSGTLTVTAP